MRKKLFIIFGIIGSILTAAIAVGTYFIIEGNKPPVEIEETEAKYTTTLLEAPTDGSLPTEHEATDVIAYTLWTVANTNSFKVITTGTADASVATQAIANERVVKDGYAMVSTVSSGIISFGTQRFFFPESENKVLTRSAKKISDTNAIWDNETTPECVSYKEMKKRYGWYPFFANGYILCDDTYLNKESICVVDNGDGTYSVECNLDPDGEKAPFWYRREIIQSSGSTMIPEFSSIFIRFTIDAKYHLLQQDIKEVYTVKAMGIKAETKTNVSDVFTYDDVEFDQDSYEWFLKYRSLSAKEDTTGDDIQVEEDSIMTMIVSSLQTNDNSDLKLKLNANVGNFINLDGIVNLNINDLDNVSVLAKIGDYLYIEYKDSILYLKIIDSGYKVNISELSLGNNQGLELDVDKLLNDLNSGTVEEKGNNLIINTSINLMGIDLNLRFDITKIDGSYTLNNASGSLNIEGIDINLSIEKNNTSIEKLDHSTFKDLDLNTLIKNVNNIIDNKEFGLNLSFIYDDIEVEASGVISFKDSLYANLDLDFKYKELEIPLNICYSNDKVYIKYDNIKFYTSIDSVLNLINSFLGDNKLNIDFNNLSSISNIKDLLSDFDNEINISEILGKLSFDLDASENMTSIEVQYDNINLDLNINNVNVNREFDGSSYNDLSELINKFASSINTDNKDYLINIVKTIVNIAKEKEFNINLDLSVYDNNIKHLDVTGNILFYIYDNGRFDLEIVGKITEYENQTIKMVHSVDLKLISKEYFIKNNITKYSEDYLFITYGTNSSVPNNLIKMYTPAKDLLNIVGTLTKLLNIDLSFLNNYSTFNFNDIDTAQITNLFSSGSVSDLNLNNIINSLVVSKNKLEVDLNLSELLDTSNTQTKLVLSVEDKDNCKAYIELNDLFTTEDTKLDVNKVSLVKDSVNISLPDVDNSWYDISAIDELVAGVIVTASSKSYEISGEVTLKALGFDAFSVPFTIKVNVDDDGSFTLYTYLDYDKSLLASSLVHGKHTAYYYKDGYVIIDTTYKGGVLNLFTYRESIKVTTEEFLGNIKYYLFDFGMRLGDTILNAMDSSETNSNTIDASKVLTGYSASGKSYSVSLNIGELTGVSGLGDLSTTIELTEVLYNNEITVDAVTKISALNMKMFSVLEVTLNEPISLTNVKLIDGSYQFTDVDMTDCINYINSYTYEVGVVKSY